MIPLHPLFLDAIRSLQAEYPAETFGGSERDGTNGCEYRLTRESPLGVVPTGWCPTVKGACDEMRYILQEVRT